MTNPIVSICCLAYNHAPFIKKTLDGFLMQEPPTGVSKDEQWYEILIHDDASTDGTDAIIREYAEKYPDMIFPMYEEINQYTHGGKGKMDLFNYKRVRGKYIAYCEGDDYWNDSQKLQKQIDFLEEHLDYSVCFHRFKNYFFQENKFEDVTPPTKLLLRYGNPADLDIDIDMFFEEWYTQPLTMVFRMSMFDFNWRNRYKGYRDMHEIYHLLKVGKGRLLNFSGGVRIVHEGGIASMLSYKQYCDVSLPIDREFFWKTLDKGPRKNYMGTLDTCVKAFAQSNKWKAIYCSLVRFIISGHPHSLWRNLKLIANSK